jgi:large subunit ribosomal protein L17
MRHGKKINHLGRTASHRDALLSNMASSLILHKRITTTVAKAKALRKYVEPIITKAKDDTTHSRRVAFSYLQNKGSVTELFTTVAEKVANRPGGYTRILKLSNTRLGDNADMCIMELVDFNELMLQDKPAKAKSRRSRRGGKGKEAEVAAPVAAAPVVEEAPVIEVAAEEAPAAEASSEEAAEGDAEATEEPKA